MNTREGMRVALNAATQAMSAAIAAAKEHGDHELRDELIAIRDSWVQTGNRGVHGRGPRGRQVVPPIVPASYSLRPPVRARARQGAGVPHLRVVERPYRDVVDDMRREAERQVRASRELLEQCRRERGLPDAG